MLTEYYHQVWLHSHPDRTEEWLKDKFRDGFHIHHIDGDHDNNSPDNLILLEGVDHLRLHGMNLKNGLAGWRKKKAAKAQRTKADNKAKIDKMIEDAVAAVTPKKTGRKNITHTMRQAAKEAHDDLADPRELAEWIASVKKKRQS